MKRFNAPILSALTLAIALLTLTALQQQPAQAAGTAATPTPKASERSLGTQAGVQAPTGGGTQNVMVVNPSTSPVPVSGGVSVTNSSSNPVQVAGSVTIANASGTPVPVSGSVTIGNTASSPVPVSVVSGSTGTGTQPFSWYGVLHLPYNDVDGTTVASFDVPAGKRLVVEYVSAEGAIANYQGYPAAVRLTAANGMYLDVPFAPPTVLQPYTQYRWVAGSQVRAYVDGGATPTTVNVGIVRNQNSINTANGDDYKAHVVGYLVTP